MSVGLLAVRLLYCFYVCVHLSKWFTFFSFKFVSVCCVVFFLRLLVTVSIRIVADCVALSCQDTRKLKRATTLEITTVSAIIFIHCYL